ncbi:hypothetical protein AVEN_273576-1 [Araneus ventricosus]|uniref:Uncharacterized protein n=1 Tax=Araneus ventricosus TaxID=182803 RepID=A0A4Y2FXU0_ARAVE|nr:hypothetical protein AVEN_223775-1 [Araneus ventricosus]GBM46270.1 hypothetical protein AVEN_273576-1 [Araneus ventricosus]
MPKWSVRPLPPQHLNRHTSNAENFPQSLNLAGELLVKIYLLYPARMESDNVHCAFQVQLTQAFIKIPNCPCNIQIPLINPELLKLCQQTPGSKQASKVLFP